jgi:hypothetical protein
VPKEGRHEQANVAFNDRPRSFFCRSEPKRKTAPYRSSDTRKISKKLTSFSAKVGDSGKVLTADKDSEIWMVSNPETLSGINGRHVKVKGS